MVPHIDFHRGGAVEALAYERLRQAPFDLLITFGIAHSGVQYPYCATAQDFETPLGVQKTDKEFVQALQARVGERFTAEQWAHKNEHSVEFVAVFLQGCEELKNTRFVPILCGGFFHELRSGDSPSANEDVMQFCAALRELVEERRAQGERIGFIASVDLAHVGPNFDHPYPITARRKKAIEKLDREALLHLESGDIEGFHEALATDANARHVDAHPAVYTVMHAFPELRAQLLHYAQAPAPEESIVSFASMAFYEV
jgi:AmmeMemoRadiSam system protein B